MSIHPPLAPAPATPSMPAAIAPIPRTSDARNWWWWQLGLPLLGFFAANLALMAWGGDRWLADQIYAWEGGHWALRDSVLTSTVIHKLGRDASILAWLLVVVAGVIAWRKPRLQAWRRPLLCLALSVLASTLLVSVLKHLIHMDCPWDLQAYGGQRPFIGLFQARPAGLHSSGCFPAGHASAGYAWVALYFFFLSVRPTWRWWGLGTGLGTGLLFGISQQLRGAHFLSHDLWTLMIAWLVALMLYRWLVHGRPAAPPLDRGARA